MQSWRPDVILHEIWEFGGPIAAASAGIPSISQTLGLRFDDRLLDLVAAYPDDAEINYQAAWVHDSLGREREAVPFYRRAIEQGLSGKQAVLIVVYQEHVGGPRLRHRCIFHGTERE